MPAESLSGDWVREPNVAQETELRVLGMALGGVLDLAALLLRMPFRWQPRSDPPRLVPH
jgi:hypothetical protein